MYISFHHKMLVKLWRERNNNEEYHKAIWYGWWYNYGNPWGVDRNYAGLDLVLSTTSLGPVLVNILLRQPVEQQEHDGENANLVQEDNNDVPEDNVENDTHRA